MDGGGSDRGYGALFTDEEEEEQQQQQRGGEEMEAKGRTMPPGNAHTRTHTHTHMHTQAYVVSHQMHVHALTHT